MRHARPEGAMDWRYTLAKWVVKKLYNWKGRDRIEKFADGTDNSIDDKLMPVLDSYFGKSV